MIGYKKDDGGAFDAGFSGSAKWSAGCVPRAIAIATGVPYRSVYDWFAHWGGHECVQEEGQSDAMIHALLHDEFGWDMMDGRFAADLERVDYEWAGLLTNPPPRVIIAIPGHLTCVVDGVHRDMADWRDEFKSVEYCYVPVSASSV